MKVDDHSHSLSIAFKFFWHIKFKLNQTGRHTRSSQLTSFNARPRIPHRWDSCRHHLMAIFSNAGTLPILPLTSSVSTMIFSPMKSWPTHLRLTLGTWRLKFSLVSALTLSTLNPFCAPDPSFGHSNHLCGNGEHQINFLVIAPATTPAPNS